jgi:hypothetical protein
MISLFIQRSVQSGGARLVKFLGWLTQTAQYLNRLSLSASNQKNLPHP